MGTFSRHHRAILPTQSTGYRDSAAEIVRNFGLSAAIPDFRRAQGRKHTAASVLTVHVLAEFANMKGCVAAAQFARSLSQEELEAIGAWLNPKFQHRSDVSL